MKTSVLVLFLISCLITACLDATNITEGTTPMSIINERIEEGAIVLSNLQLGQKSFFLGGEIICENGDFLFHHSGDTLILEIVEALQDSSNGEANTTSFRTSFYIQETARGPNIGEGFELRYPIYFDEGKILLPERENSALFFFYDSDQLHLLPFQNAENRVIQSGCDLLFAAQQDLFNGDIIAEVLELEISPFIIIDGEKKPASSAVVLEQKAAVACRPINLDGNGYLIHDNHQLLMSYNYNNVAFPGDTTTLGWGFILKDLISW